MYTPEELAALRQKYERIAADPNLHPIARLSAQAELRRLQGEEIPFFPGTPISRILLPAQLINYAKDNMVRFREIVKVWFTPENITGFGRHPNTEKLIGSARISYIKGLQDTREPVIGTRDDLRALQVTNPENLQVLDASPWCYGVNDAWLTGAIEAGRRVRILSNINEAMHREGPLPNKPGVHESVMNRELRLLHQHGYRFLQDQSGPIGTGWLFPPIPRSH